MFTSTVLSVAIAYPYYLPSVIVDLSHSLSALPLVCLFLISQSSSSVCLRTPRGKTKTSSSNLRGQALSFCYDYLCHNNLSIFLSFRIIGCHGCIFTPTAVPLNTCVFTSLIILQISCSRLIHFNIYISGGQLSHLV